MAVAEVAYISQKLPLGHWEKKVDAIYIYNSNLLWFNWASIAKLGSEIVSNSEKNQKKIFKSEKIRT